MYAVLAEDHSDVEVLKTLVGRLHLKKSSAAIQGKGYDGCSEMLRKGARDLKLYAKRRCTRFIVCYDSDRADPGLRRQRVLDQVIKPSGITEPICVLVPVQEIEAWILADLDCVKSVIKSWRSKKAIPNPESITNPKEYLIKLSRENGRPLYAHATHNPVVARTLDLDKVHAKCPSFRPLVELVQRGNGNLK